MPKFKRSKIFLLIGTVVFLFIFVFLPVLGHFGKKWHLVNLPFVIPMNEWENFSSPEGKFSVWFPGVPDITNVVSSVSNVDVSQPCYFIWNRQTEYAVGYGDWPKNLERLKPEQIFDIDQKGVATEVGKIVYQKDIEFENHSSREFEYVVDGKVRYSGRVRLILVSDRLYQLMVIFLTANPHTTDRDIFFSSFRLQN
jgi:hypothetical protein